MNISDKIKYIGVDDTTLDLFESQYAVQDGVSYNSYVILDDKTAIMDTVDKRGMKDWENNLLNALDGRNADYVIIQHMEPDHAGSLARLIELFPEITVVGNAKTFVMINQFFENINIKNSLTVKEGDTLYIIAKKELGDANKCNFLKELNKLNSIHGIKVGQVIRLE